MQCGMCGLTMTRLIAPGYPGLPDVYACPAWCELATQIAGPIGKRRFNVHHAPAREQAIARLWQIVEREHGAK